MVDLYSHQIDAISRLKSGNILRGDVGTGKSRTAVGWYYFEQCKGDLSVNGNGSYSEMETPKDLYIITTAQKRDKKEWEDDLAPFGLSPHNDSNPSGINIFIDSWNNIKKYLGVKDSVFIFDEQRLVGSGTWVKTFYKISKINSWILLTATPGDSWSDYIPVFVANGFYKNKTAMLREHAVYSRYTRYPSIEKWISTGKLKALQKKIVIYMPYEKPTVPHKVTHICEYDKEKYKLAWKKRFNYLTNKPIKNISELCMLLRRISNSDESRLNFVKNAVGEYDRIIVFYNFDYELEALRTLEETCQVPVREWNGHIHQPIPNTNRWVYLVQFTSGSEGWNCTDTNVEIFYSLNYSYRTMTQAAGRIDRLNTEYRDLYYYTLRSDSKIDRSIEDSIKNKKIFNELSFVQKV